jgi:NAD-dependent SIR2 family protein deacetylase
MLQTNDGFIGSFLIFCQQLMDWFENKSSVLCITGAGLSTESGVPDYRGHNGSYRKGHVPMIHDQFMKSEAQRRRYWGRGMVGWRQFDLSQPNVSFRFHSSKKTIRIIIHWL